MAGIKIGVKVRAAGILEVIVAMVVIVVIFGLGMMIFTNVTRSSLTKSRLHTEAVLQQELIRAESDRTLTDSSYTIDSCRISRSFKHYPANERLWQISITALENEKDSALSVNKIIYP